jgi:hypothetical protein
MKSRDEALQCFTEFHAIAETFSGEKVTILHVNNTPELIKGKFKHHCRLEGISYEKTVPDSPSQNGVAECCNLTLASMTRAMLIDTNLSDWFWPFAIQATVHIKNHVPHSILPPHKTPFKFWHHYKPNLSHLQPFGVSCTTCIISNNLSKFEPCGEAGHFLGYAKDAKGYLIWVPGLKGRGGLLKTRRDVVFHDYPSSQSVTSMHNDLSPLWDDVVLLDDLEEPELMHHRDTWDTPLSRPKNPNIPRDTPLSHPMDVCVPRDTPLSHPMCSDKPPSHHDTSMSHPSVSSNPILVRPKRAIQLPSRYNDFIDSDTVVQQLLLLDEDEITIPITDGIPLLSAINLISDADARACNLHDDNASDPGTVTEARQSKYWTEWLAAMHEKLASLKAKGVYDEIDVVPANHKPIQCKWVLHIKHNKTGTISRFKARLVAKGFTQIPGQDFSFTFAPIACWDSIHSLLCLAAINDLEIRQLDVKTAYLNGPLEEEIYMTAPEGFSYTSPFWRL